MLADEPTGNLDPRNGSWPRPVVIRDGTIHQGYEQRSRAEDVFLTPLGSHETLRIPAAQVREKKTAGTAMPPNLTAALRPEQLRDLIHFLTQSRGGAEGK